MTKFVSLVAVALCVASTSASPCSSFDSCQTCLGDGLFCGWCSPEATVFNNGTIGSQCQDQHESGWHCNHQYSTAKCLPGYACNGTTGQCFITEAGKGDTKANCEASCKITPKPKGLSTCNLKSKTCEPCKDYCNVDADCPGSYCQVGLCHGSTCQTNATCSSQCTSDTPDELVGVWRGVLISSGFAMGEFDFKFQKEADGPQVQFKGTDGKVSSGSLESDKDTGGRDITITYTDGPLKGSVYNGAYDPWEPSTETLQTAFYFGAPSQAKPLDITTAMAGNGQTVYVMSICNPHVDSKHCDFSSVFTSTDEPSLVDFITAMLAAPVDPCTQHPTCGVCIGDTTGLCGWCDTNVTYDDNSTGTQCAGFDSTGKPLGWTCKGVFHKDKCTDYGCDWSDIKNPQCVECTADNCKDTKDDCEKECVPPPTLYSCNNATKKCDPCKSDYCTTDKECPGSYCQKSGFGPWSCHGGTAGGCSTNSSCAASCGKSPEKEDYFLCDKFSGQCVNVTKDTPGAQSKYTCQHECQSAAPTGTWRGVQVSHGFTTGEFDFTFYDDSTVHWRTPDKQVFVAKFEGLNLTKAQDGTIAISGAVTASDDTAALPVGTAVYVAFKIDGSGNDDIAQLLFWGLSTKGPVASLDDAMLESEFVMVGCGESTTTCDFSSASV